MPNYTAFYTINTGIEIVERQTPFCAPDDATAITVGYDFHRVLTNYSKSDTPIRVRIMSLEIGSYDFHNGFFNTVYSRNILDTRI